METELSRLYRLGHEELSLNYLMGAEILLAEEMRKRAGLWWIFKPIGIWSWRRNTLY